jgi:uncharacterized protein with ATP-grasp and redox domains
MQHLARADFERSPAELVTEVERLAHRPLGTTNPFAEDKRAHTAGALAIEQKLRETIAGVADPLYAALKVACGANTLDANVFGPVDLRAGVDRALAAGFAIDDYPDFQKDLAAAHNLLFICDSAGETVADKLLIEILVATGKSVTYIVRRAPILNDATREDAEAAGLADLAPIIDTGSEAMGTPLNLTSQEFRSRFEQADLVLAKGAANYETLDGEPKTKYFLIAVKCVVVARHFGVSIGDFIFMKD